MHLRYNYCVIAWANTCSFKMASSIVAHGSRDHWKMLNVGEFHFKLSTWTILGKYFHD